MKNILIGVAILLILGGVAYWVMLNDQYSSYTPPVAPSQQSMQVPTGSHSSTGTKENGASTGALQPDPPAAEQNK